MSPMDSSGLSKDDQDKLIKIQELTVILKVFIKTKKKIKISILIL